MNILIIIFFVGLTLFVATNDGVHGVKRKSSGDEHGSTTKKSKQNKQEIVILDIINVDGNNLDDDNILITYSDWTTSEVPCSYFTKYFGLINDVLGGDAEDQTSSAIVKVLSDAQMPKLNKTQCESLLNILEYLYSEFEKDPDTLPRTIIEELAENLQELPEANLIDLLSYANCFQIHNCVLIAFCRACAMNEQIKLDDLCDDLYEIVFLETVYLGKCQGPLDDDKKQTINKALTPIKLFHRGFLPQPQGFVGDWEQTLETASWFDILTVHYANDTRWAEIQQHLFSPFFDQTTFAAFPEGYFKMMVRYAYYMQNGQQAIDDNDIFNAIFNDDDNIDLSNKNLTTLDEGITDLLYLRNQQRPILELVLANNQLTTVPDFQYLTALTYLNLDNNKLTTVPDFQHLTALTYLYFSDNQRTTVPDFNLPQLKYLWLDNNKLTTIPDFQRLIALTDLELRNNPGITIPQALLTRETARTLTIYR